MVPRGVAVGDSSTVVVEDREEGGEGWVVARGKAV